VRNALKVDDGDRVDFVQMAANRFELVAANCSITERKGMFGQSTQSISVDDINTAIAKRGPALSAADHARKRWVLRREWRVKLARNGQRRWLAAHCESRCRMVRPSTIESFQQ